MPPSDRHGMCLTESWGGSELPAQRHDTSSTTLLAASLSMMSPGLRRFDVWCLRIQLIWWACRPVGCWEMKGGC
eukprot:451373-Pelagomonas_calceolata.AAC.2